MIVNHLSELLAQRGMSLAELQRRTELGSLPAPTYANLHALAKGKTRRIDFATLDAICAALGCSVGDILEHVPGGES